MKKKPPTAAPGAIAKLLRMSLGALWMTEEGVRKTVGDLRLPRDATSYLFDQIDKRKTEILKLLRTELHLALSRIDITQLTRNILANHDIEIDAKIRFTPRRETRK